MLIEQSPFVGIAVHSRRLHSFALKEYTRLTAEISLALEGEAADFLMLEEGCRNALKPFVIGGVMKESRSATALEQQS
jgi:hypothetical protein